MDTTIVCVCERERAIIIVVGSFVKLCCKVGPKEIVCLLEMETNHVEVGSRNGGGKW